MTGSCAKPLEALLGDGVFLADGKIERSGYQGTRVGALGILKYPACSAVLDHFSLAHHNDLVT